EDHRLGDVPGELRMTFDHRDLAGTPAFIRGRKLRGATERESWNQLQGECRRMVVVNENDDVGLLLRDPFPGKLVALEQRLPVRLFGLAEVDGGADCRHV